VFLCIHHCPFVHTYEVLPYDLQNAWLATTSNEELGQEEDTLALPLVEEFPGEYIVISTMFWKKCLS